MNGLSIDITDVVKAILVILGSIITYYVVPWIKEHRLENWVRIATEAAELVYGAGHGDEKLAYAEEYLASKGIIVDTMEIKYMIDAAVSRINNENKLVGAASAKSDNTES